LDTICYSSDHMQWFLVLGLPVLIVIVAGFPIAGVWKLLLEDRRGRLNDHAVLSTVGFLYDGIDLYAYIYVGSSPAHHMYPLPILGYQNHLYFWDVFTFIRNIALSVIIVFLDSSTTDGNYQQGLAALLVFLCSNGLHFFFQPYANEELNYLEGLGLIVSMMTLYLGLWTFAITSDFAVNLASVFIFIINGSWLFCVMAIFFSSFRTKVTKAYDVIVKACVCKRGGSRDGEALSSQAPDHVLEIGGVDSLRDGGGMIYKANPLHFDDVIQPYSQPKVKTEVFKHK
jgi:hypothetical protein